MLELRAIIFDFNGVIADDELPHFLMFQQALSDYGIAISKEEYYGTYLGMDKRNCTIALLLAHGKSADPPLVAAIQDRKASLFREYATVHPPQLFPGVVDFIKEAKTRYRLAIASGGRREQIERALRSTPIEQDFEIIVSAEDVRIGKPDPEIYQVTLAKLNSLPIPSLLTINPSDVVVIEDSRAGIQAGLSAGMFVIALSTTYPVSALTEAHVILRSLAELSLAFPAEEAISRWGFSSNA
jgi:HAD superfamily hydrolase (TIGR01509 family)